MTGVATWSRPEVERLEQLAAERRSGSVIANLLSREFGVARSRNAVLGKAMREAIQLLGNPYYVRPRNGQRPGPKPGFVRKPVWRKPMVYEVKPIEPPVGHHCSLLELTLTSCRWPIGDPRSGELLFCGAAVACAPYCPYHHALGTQGGRNGR